MRLGSLEDAYLEPTRLLIADMQPLLRRVLARIVREDARFELVAQVDRPHSLEAVAGETNAQVVIVGEDSAYEAPLASLLASRPGLRVLYVIDDGAHAVLSELRPRQRVYGHVSLETLLAALATDEDQWTSSTPLS